VLGQSPQLWPRTFVAVVVAVVVVVVVVEVEVRLVQAQEH